MDDSALVRVRQRAEHLSSGLDRRRVVELPAPQRLAERAAGHVLVSDVDVAGVASEPVGALAGRMAQPGGRLCLPFRPGRRLSLARDDLQRHVESVLLVTSEPDGARAAAAKRTQRAVATEHQLALDQRWGGVRHRLSWVGGGTGKSCPAWLRPRYGL